MKILPVYYFPPVAWFAAALQAEEFVLEQWMHYRKQNYYNRTSIKTPDKILNLSIPVRKAAEETPICKCEIAYDWRWQHDHWKSLESAYRRSPYFEYYEDDIKPFFETEEPSLLKYNLDILETVAKLLDIDLKWTLSESYQGSEAYSADLRNGFPTKTEDLPSLFIPKPYLQVFGETFSPNLSILDLLFNKGPESGKILKDSWQPTSI
jgi:hypothetical protein